jgi:quercetin dioxygenase-like cupin family protein
MRIFLTAALCMLAFQTTDRSQSTPGPTHRIVLPSDIKWQVDTVDSRFSAAVVLGNPDNPGLYMGLNKAQDGATIPPHWHSQDENLIVLSGTFLVGIGDKFDEHALQSVPAGGYLFLPGKMHHFCKIKGETVWEIFGEGPFTFEEVKPADNPKSEKQ